MIQHSLQRDRRSASRNPAGTRSSSDWLNRSIGPPRALSQCMIGVAGRRPTASRGSRGRHPQRPSPATGASAATV